MYDTSAASYAQDCDRIADDRYEREVDYPGVQQVPRLSQPSPARTLDPQNKLNQKEQTATEQRHGPDAIVGITDHGGYLPLDLAGLIGQTWQEAAQGW